MRGIMVGLITLLTLVGCEKVEDAGRKVARKTGSVVVCGSLDNGLPGRGKEYWIHDCSAASMNILLAAHGLGLGAVWTGVFPGEERIAIVREILAIPDGYAPLNVIPIGYPAEDPAVKNKWNPAKIHADRW